MRLGEGWSAHSRGGAVEAPDLHRSLGVSDEHHVVRPVVRRGRAETGNLGVLADYRSFEAELTVTVDGAFWSPFGPTVTNGVLDIDLLVSRVTRPLDQAVDRLLDLPEGRPSGDDNVLNIC